MATHAPAAFKESLIQEKAAPKHDWWDWYAAYITARQHGSTPEEASSAARRYMEEVRHVVLPK